jgi:hypothetical protein
VTRDPTKRFDANLIPANFAKCNSPGFIPVHFSPLFCSFGVIRYRLRVGPRLLTVILELSVFCAVLPLTSPPLKDLNTTRSCLGRPELVRSVTKLSSAISRPDMIASDIRRLDTILDLHLMMDALTQAVQPSI